MDLIYMEKKKIYTTEDFRLRFAGRHHGIQGAKGRFAVIVPVVDIDGEAHLLYELRSSHIDRQPGEVCFPGGEIENNEKPRQAAIRETWEETGIAEDELEIICELDTFHPPSDIVIYPFLASIEASVLPHMRLSECEVEECFTVPVSFLLKKPYTYEYSMHTELGEDFRYDKIGLQEQTYNWRPMNHRIISWEYEGKYIWGLTALITEWTLNILRDRIK